MQTMLERRVKVIYGYIVMILTVMKMMRTAYMTYGVSNKVTLNENIVMVMIKDDVFDDDNG